MAITLCTVSGNVKSLLGANIQACTINVSVPAPFWHSAGPSWISGQLGSATTDASGNFSIAVIETTTPGQKVTFTFDYFDGVSGRRKFNYPVIVPNQASANLVDLVGTSIPSAAIPLGVQYGGTGLTTLPQYAVLLGNAANSPSSAAPGTSGYPLVSNGAAASPSFQVLPVAGGGTGSGTSTGSGAVVLQTSPTLVSPALGTPASGVLTNCTGTAAGLTAGNVTTNANLTGPITSSGNATSVAAQTGSGSTFVMQGSPTLTTPNLGTPSAGVLTNCSGTAASLTAGHVTTNANLTGPITSSGNATSVAAQTGTGSTFVMQASPTLTTPDIGTPSAGVLTNCTGLPVGGGGTGVTSVTTAPTASSFAGWDANKNLSANNHLEGYRTQAAANSTLALVVGDAYTQAFTGSTSGQVVTLPVVSGLALNQAYNILNLSTQTVTVQSSGGNTLQAMAANTQLTASVISTSGTGTASWSWAYTALQNSIAGGGSVTSVTFTGDGTVLSSTPSSAVTASGTVTAALATQSANRFIAGPTSGSAAAPTARAVTSADVNATTVSDPQGLVNLALSASISSGLVVAIKQKDGSTNPTADNPAIYSIRNATATTGDYTQVAVTAASSVTLATAGINVATVFHSGDGNFTFPLYVYGASGGTLLLSPALVDENSTQSYIAESADVTSISNASPGVVTLNSHGLLNGDAIGFTTSGGLPTGLAINTTYYVVSKATNTFQLSATPGGTAINTSSSGSGTHTWHVYGNNRLVCSKGTAAASGVGVKLLGRVTATTSAGAWNAVTEVSPRFTSSVRTVPTIQKFTSGSGTYETPANALYIRVRMVGGGGGGASSGSASQHAGSNGGDSTFGGLTAGGGIGGTLNAGGQPGTASLGTGWSGLALNGGGGEGAKSQAAVNDTIAGAMGAASAFGGAGYGQVYNTSGGSAGTTNTGGGGGGGGSNNTVGCSTGGGGGSGAYIDAISTTLSPAYAYAVGAVGAGGTPAGTSGVTGGAGGSGIIIVEEYYQ